MQRARAKVLLCFGTRPEAIKMIPVIKALKAFGTLDVRIAVTAQHRGLLDQILADEDLIPDVDLDLMQESQSLEHLAARILTGFSAVIDTETPDRVVIHGDTLTSTMVAQACYFRQIPVAHIEAGLRSGDIYAPWPEEGNRRLSAVIADMHFAPTQRAAQALLDENIAADRVHVTGNTAIDALQAAQQKLLDHPELASRFSAVRDKTNDYRIIAVTAHRRENFGLGMTQIADALRQLAGRGDVAIIYPLHPNPHVCQPMREALADCANVHLIEPMGRADFVALLEAASLILTDSGGLQEEAPHLGKPVLVMRDTTERPEGIEAGTAMLVGADSARIVDAASQLLDDPAAYAAMANAHNPYGDGKAALRIARIIANNC